MNTSFFKKFALFAGPALLISVGYMDPGNWATDIEAGSRFGYGLLFVILLSSIAAILLQCLSFRVGIASARDLAQLSRASYSKGTNLALWFLAEIAIIACDLAEVLGAALALNLMFKIPIVIGILITAFDTLLIIGLKKRGFRQIEAVILVLVATITACFMFELYLVGPVWGAVVTGLVPSLEILGQGNALYLAIGIIGATIMPHNLYLHSYLVQSRQTDFSDESKKTAITYATIDTVVSLGLAFFVNAAILVLAATAFHAQGHNAIADIGDAYHLLDRILPATAASFVFGLALLASGQSSTFTGTIAGQVVLEGYLNLKISYTLRRLITRALAIIPAWIGVLVLGDGAIGKLLVFSQVVLSFQLPFAIFPLIRFASSAKIMGKFAIGVPWQIVSWGLFAFITGANVWLMISFFA